MNKKTAKKKLRNALAESIAKLKEDQKTQ